jgi:HEAT repeat protein
MRPEEREPTGGNPSPTLAVVLRMDLRRSRAAASRDIPSFASFMALLRKQVAAYPARLGIDEGEGDSIRQAFTDVRAALNCAFFLRNRAQQPVETTTGLYSLAPRIVLHFGEFIESEDRRAIGKGQITVTGLDHAVWPGEIWATQAFVDVARHIHADEGFSFDYRGPHVVDKSSEQHHCYAVSLADGAPPPHDLQRPYNPVEIAEQLLVRGDLSSQTSAVEVLGTDESKVASRRLVDIVVNTGTERRVRHAALVKLQERGGDVDVETIKDAYDKETSDVETRALLLLVLGATGSRVAVETLTNVVRRSTEDSRLREAALLAMRGLGGKDVREAIEDSLRDDEEDVVRIAACVAAASGRMRKGVQERLYEILQDAKLPMDLRCVACEALASQQPAVILSQRLAGLVQDRTLPLTLRRYALDGLAPSDFPEAMRAVEEVVQRIDDALQVEAISALTAMRAPRGGARRRVRQPASHLAEVIRHRTRPQSGGAQTPAP